MKSLGKLKINSAKMLNNEELINLRGGYGASDCGEECRGDCNLENGKVGNCVKEIDVTHHTVTCTCQYMF
jgi:natural product precursor